ncbi:hypothetical protein EVG20_g8352 [Dentipellis fragilis]|uniref:Uncharacterized protein n=1 Tax=Dentipellis fragilis TaxID=205917 RepID=A0A4Y9Y6G7_9AGAM|nr:hypothetical protein EVG20_g8352 [Dentipellis fragilis]
MPSRKQLPSSTPVIEISQDGTKAKCLICASCPNPPAKQWLHYENMLGHLKSQRHAHAADKDLRKKKHLEVMARRRQDIKAYRDQLNRESGDQSESSHGTSDAESDNVHGAHWQESEVIDI